MGQPNYARERAKAQIEDYIQRGLEQGSPEVKEFVLKREAWNTSWIDLLEHSIRTENCLYGLLKTRTLSSIEPDPLFNAQASLDSIRMEMPINYWKNALNTQSAAEMQAYFDWTVANHHSQEILKRSLGLPWDEITVAIILFIMATVFLMNLQPLIDKRVANRKP